MMFSLSNEERERLMRFNNEKSTIFALKKLFLDVCVKSPASNEAIMKVTEAFHALEVIQPDIETEKNEGNMV